MEGKWETNILDRTPLKVRDSCFFSRFDPHQGQIVEYELPKA